MAAITKSWVNILDGAIDPDSPITTALMTALRDNAIHLREWLGASYTAGAVQDHNHDGANSALVEVGPNLLRNGSFEQSEAGWSFTDYAGGSHGIPPGGAVHGASDLAITSTVLANGGGYALHNGYVPCAASEVMLFKGWISASVAHVSSEIVLAWYNAALSHISSTVVYTNVNTPTAATLLRAQVTAPSNAKFCRLVLSGGLPGVGASVGTVRFDGMSLSDWAISKEYMLPAAVGQAQLKTSTGTVSSSSTSEVNLTLPGGAFGFYPQLRHTGGNSASSRHALTWSNSAGPTTAVITLQSSNTNPVYADQTYVQASPPYDLGDGDVPLFVFAAVDSGGRVVQMSVSEDPPWANNGPTNSRADYYRAGVGYQRIRDLSKWSPAEIEAMPWREYSELLREAPIVERAVTQALKQADMSVIPHPFPGLAADLSVVLIDPVSDLCRELAALQRDREPIHGLFLGRDLLLDNEPLARAAPPGVLPIRARWKESAR